MATVEKIRKDIEKTKEKISAQQKHLRELEAQLTEEENLEIVRMVKAVRMDNKELTAFLKAYASGLITLPDGMMEAEAAALRSYGAEVRIVPIDVKEISSTMVREAVRRADDISSMVPENVAEYIWSHYLYYNE